MLFVPPAIPFMVPAAEALTEEECLALPQYDYQRFYTVLTCQTIGFDVTVYPGQRLMIQDPNGGSADSLPWSNVQGHGETGATGTYQYESGSYSGIVRIVDPPSIGVSIQNVTATFSGSQMTVSGHIANSNSYPVKDLFVMWYVTDDAGNKKGTWRNNIPDSSVADGNSNIQAGSYPPLNEAAGWHQQARYFSYTFCCGDSGMTTATPYIVQAFREDGTPLVNVPVYPGSAELTQLKINSFEVYEEGSQTRYSVTLEGPLAGNTQFTLTDPDGQTHDGGGSYNHSGLVSSTSSLIYGIWNFKACLPEYDMCVEQTFTVNNPTDTTTSTVMGTMWDDNNSNGVFDDGEGLGNVQCIDLSWSGGTDRDCVHVTGGVYTFSNLTPGEYTVSHEDVWPHLDRTRIGPESVSFVLSSDETKVVNFGMSCYFDCVAATDDTTFPAETPAIILGMSQYNLDSSQYQLSHEFTGNTPKIWITFNQWVPTKGSLVNIVAVFPNAQSGVSKTSVNVPYTLTYPGGTEEGTLTHINTSNLYDMVLSISNAPVAGHYVFQTELISTSFDVYDLSTAAGQQANVDAEEEANSQAEIITMDIINQSDNKFFIDESFTIQGHWQNPTSDTVFIRVEATNSGVITWTTNLSLDQNNNFTTTIDVADVATQGVLTNGGYMVSACALSATCNYDTFSREQFWLIEQDANASIILTADKTTLDRTMSNYASGYYDQFNQIYQPYDYTTITANYQNLNSVANYHIRSPDGVEVEFGGFATGGSGVSTFNVGLGLGWPLLSTADFFDVIVDDGATSGELTIQIVGTFANATDTTLPTFTAVSDSVGNSIPLSASYGNIMQYYTTNSSGIDLSFFLSLSDMSETGNVTCQLMIGDSDVQLLPSPVNTVTTTASGSTTSTGTTVTAFNTHFPTGLSAWTCAVPRDGNVQNHQTVTVDIILEDTAAAEEIVIPSWIKNNAGWWASNQIDDRSFVSGLQWLITNGVMHIPPTEQGAGSDDVIPSWIKNNAGWWADDLIDDRNFVTGLQWLITNGVMVIG